MSATSKNGGLLGFVSFKVSNPINNFKATFKKHIEQQCNSPFHSTFRDPRESHVSAPSDSDYQYGLLVPD
jgi:hypothetical protein